MLMSQIQMIELGIPSVGINLFDFVVAGMAVSVLFRWRAVKDSLRQARAVQVLLCGACLLATAALAKGILSGYPLRVGLRNFRFYIYTVIIFHFAVLLSKEKQLQRIMIGWACFAPVQLVLAGTGTVAYSIYNLGNDVFATTISSTNIHFLPIKSYFPVTLALGLLALAGRQLGWGPKLALWALAGFQLVVAFFSYSRSVYMGMLGGLASIAAGAIIGRVRGGAPFLRVAGTLLRVLATLIVVSGITLWAVGSATGADTREALNSIVDRFLFVRVIHQDPAITERLEGFEVGWRDVASSPLLGTGLGSAADPGRAAVFHSGWFWIAASAGVPTLLLMLAAFFLVIRATLKTLGGPGQGPVLSGFQLGIMASLVAWTVSTATQTSTMDLTDVFDWGFLLGLSTALAQPGRAPALGLAATRTRGLQRLPEELGKPRLAY